MSHLVSEFSADDRLLTLHDLHPQVAELIARHMAVLYPYFRRVRSYLRKTRANARHAGQANPDLNFDQLVDEVAIGSLLNITLKGTADQPEVHVAWIQPNFRLASTRYSSRQILPASVLASIVGKQVCEVIEGHDRSTIVKAFASTGLTFIRCNAKPCSIAINLGP